MDEADYFDAEFTSLAEDLLAKYHVPSISIAVVDNGKTFSKAFGLARFPSTRATSDTFYFTGSTTKAMIAATLGILIKNPEKPKFESKSGEPLSWKTPIRSILGDDFELEDSYATENTTIEDMLSHRVGMSGTEMFYGGYISSSPREITKRVRYLGPLNQPFRTTFQYNNFMFAIAGDVIETLTGKPCDEALRELLWKPLGMERTFWHLKQVIDAPRVDTGKDMSRGYHWILERGSKDDASKDGYFVPDNFIDFAGVAPAGAVISTVNDYSKWMQALLDAASAPPQSDSSAQPHSSSPITRSLFEDVTSPRITISQPLPDNAHISPGAFALGWEVINSTLGPFHPIIAHSGGLTGYGTMLYLLPNDSFGVVSMGNTQIISGLVGGILCQELITRKMGLKSTGREHELKDFNLFMKATMIGLEHVTAVNHTDNTTDTAREMLKKTAQKAGQDVALDEFTHKDAKNAADIERFVGIFENKAYGRFRVTFTPATSDSRDGAEKFGAARVQSRFKRVPNLNKIKDDVRATCHSLRVQPEGGRTWNWEYMLHPRTPQTERESTGSATDDSTVTWFDQEWLDAHGLVEKDVAPGIPTGIEEGQESSQCKREKVWESLIWTRLGAALVKDESGKLKMGLTLANANFVTDGTREKGWEEKKVWFHKVE